MTEPHVPMTKAELLAVLDDIRAHLEGDDSFEGYLNYLMPFDGDDLSVVDFRVEAGFRVGNSMGQGGYRLIGNYGEASHV